MPTNSYWIPTANLGKLADKIEKINRKAARLNCPAIEMVETGKTRQEPAHYEAPEAFEIEAGGRPPQSFIELREIAVTGNAPKINGWSFVATLEHASELGNVLRVIPGYDKQLPEQYRTASSENCDHCREKRRRNDTYVLAHENGRDWRQVGSTCLKDFLGYNDPHSAARYCELLFAVAEACESAGDWGGGGGERVVDLTDWLAYCAAQVRIEGFFVSRKRVREAEEMGRPCPAATADAAMTVMSPPRGMDRAFYAKLRERHPNDEDRAYAAKVAEWCVALKDRTDLNDFMHNLKVATATGFVGGRRFAIAAAALPTYRREIEQIQPTGKGLTRNPDLDSKHFGTEGERAIFNVTLRKMFPVNTQFGVSFLHKFVTAEGNVAIWFSNKPSGMVEGEQYIIKGTVKRHDERQGIKQTNLARVAVQKPKAPKLKAVK